MRSSLVLLIVVVAVACVSVDARLWQLDSAELQAPLHGRALLHAGHNHAAAATDQSPQVLNSTSGGNATLAASDSQTSIDTTNPATWFKWTAGAVLFVEGLIGILVAPLLKMTRHGAWLLSLLNCFTGGILFTFGVMHLIGDAAGAMEELQTGTYPLSYLFVIIGFFSLFFLQKVLAPILRSEFGIDTHVHGKDGAAVAVQMNTDASHAKLDPVDIEKEARLCHCAHECGDDCTCGNCGPLVGLVKDPEAATNSVGSGSGCQCSSKCGADCKCGVNCRNCGTQLNKFADSASDSDLPPCCQGNASADAAPLAVAPPRQPTRTRVLLSWVSPALVMAAIMAHGVFEGLSLGLQNGYSNVGTVFIAMASHKWVESIAISTRFLKVGASWIAILAFLIPFAAGPFLGIAIGVSVANSSLWAEMVFDGLIAGVFIYVGAYEIVAEEMEAGAQSQETLRSRPRLWRLWLFCAILTGVTIAALLQMVPH